MKSKLTTGSAAITFLALSAAFAIVCGTAIRAAEPKKPVPPARNPSTDSITDPATGLPISMQWMDANWRDPDKMLGEVFFDGLPISEVAKILRNEFKDAFDVLIPRYWQDPGALRSMNPEDTSVTLRLKNVTASQVFAAMNLMFETQNSPVRWQLTMNGDRPTAVLHVLPALVPPPPPQPAFEPPERRTRIVYFVGDLVGDEKSGGMTMEQLVKIVSEVYEMSYGPRTSGFGGGGGGAPDPNVRPKNRPPSSRDISNVLQFHKDAQLLIVNGTVDQTNFFQQTLSALRQKMELTRASQPKDSIPKDKTEPKKTP